jgi:hypothetical protein
MEIHNKTDLRFKRSTQMAHTHTSKPEIGSIVRKQFCIALHAFRCLNKHLTGAPSSYTPLLGGVGQAQRLPSQRLLMQVAEREIFFTRYEIIV